MPHKGPHISISSDKLVPRVLGIDPEQLKQWPEAVRDLALELSEELFLIRYNPFVNPAMVHASVQSRFRQAMPSLSQQYVAILSSSIKQYWQRYGQDQEFRKTLIARLSKKLPKDSIDTRPSSLVECATDATDLRMALPLLVVAPRTTEQVQYLVKLANEMRFALVPRGGGSGLTGGAIPGHNRTVILSLSKFKAIVDINTEDLTLCAEAGVITLDAINAAAKRGALFTVDPASKAASSIGGNISENSGGPFAFEYGTTLDNILSYRMVTPQGELLDVRRKDHPRHKILPHETPVFEVYEILKNGSEILRDTIELPGNQIRGANLGKDVTNKYLGGLPGVQKEGVDGIITQGCFTLYPLPKLSRSLCLEFFGPSMRHAMLVIKDLIALRDTIRKQGDLVKFSALEEFGIKYVKAIDYKKKSSTFEGMPNSVLLLQFDSDDQEALDDAVNRVVDLIGPYDNVDVFTARDDKEAEFFWEDRHKLSAIAKRTSGFKINEDIVIPTDVIPEFSDFIEELNLTYRAKAYRMALQEVGRTQGVADYDKFINMEFSFATRILNGETTTADVSDQELELQVFYFFRDLKSRYPDLEKPLDKIYERMQATRVEIANHMHAGDGNCHVNIPVDSNNPLMLHLAEEAAASVMTRVLELKGQVSGEHGIGITKIGFLSDEKIKALKEYKQQVDPSGVLNPGKLTQRELPETPYTFSFNKLIQDILRSGLPEKERLIGLLKNIQVCTRCGKCKQVCPMYFPEQSFLYHPRNKNISLGALIEAIYYSQISTGTPNPKLMDELRKLMEHCTACGKCTAICPVKIDSPGVALNLRAFLDDKGHGGHPVKNRILHYLANKPSKRVPQAAKMAALGQAVQNKLVGLIPAPWRRRMESPLFSGKGPALDYKNLQSALHLNQGSLFVPSESLPVIEVSEETGREFREAVLYFPGCGGSLFYHSIGLAGLMLLLDSPMAVVLPKEHLCCGYPLLAGGCEEAFATNRGRNEYALKKLLDDAHAEGLKVTTLLTACGSCREGLERYGLNLKHMDVAQFLLERLGPGSVAESSSELLYHAACHAEWTGVHGIKASEQYRASLETLTNASVRISPQCCGESGLGALTSPEIYSRLRKRKQEQLGKDLEGYGANQPIVVGCPSCKVGISRSMLSLKDRRPVLHTLEYLAARLHGPDWKERFIEATAGTEVTGSALRTVEVPSRTT